ncbi:hypothetical protein STEG23_036992 [Scotinomys teguina]
MKLKIKKSTLERFLEECDMVVPWFAVSGSLTVASCEKLGRDLDFAAEQGTLKSGAQPVWKMVRGCLEDQRYGEAVENGQAALEMLQEERSEKYRGSSNSFSPEAWRMVRSEMQLAYPVFQDPQGQRYHKPLDFKVIKSLAESVRTYGLMASFTLAQDQQDPLWVPERLVRRIPEDRKAEDVASMDDVKSVEPALVDDIGPAVPPNGDRA